MKSLYTLISVLFILSSLTSCIKVKDDNSQNTVLDHKILDTAVLLIPEKVDFEVPISAYGVYVWQDSIILVCNSHLDKRHKFLEVYDLHTSRFLRDYIHIGNGPDEMLAVAANYQNDTILLQDVMKRTITVIPVDSAISDTFIPMVIPFDIYSQQMWPYKGKMLALNPNCFIDERIGVHNDGLRFIISDSNFVYKENEEYLHNTYNAVLASFIISYKNNRIVVYNSNEPEIEIYDTNLNLIKKIHGPELPHEITYGMLKNGNVLTEGDPASYMYSCFDSKYFYLSYIGDFLEMNETVFNVGYSYILKFDWDGNPVDSYYIDLSVLSMSLSEDGQSMYLFGIDKDGYNVLYKTALK